MTALPCTPWRSVWPPRAIAIVALTVGLPLFLRSPPWCDITLYQMAARNILDGGIHYRDLFDTNLPGFVWIMTALYWLFGPNVIVVRALDLTIVFGIVLLLDRLAKWGGATPVGRWWAVAGAAVFYPFTVEMSHSQRDTWMMLPALAAVTLRLRRAVRGEPTPPAPFPKKEGGDCAASPLARESTSLGSVGLSPPSFSPRAAETADAGEARHAGQTGKGAGGLGYAPLRLSFFEGALWGAGVWLKPHIALMALCVWLLTAWRLAGEHPRPRRALAADLLGNVLGGLAVGIPGVLWMRWAGVWDPFIEVFTLWNPRYMKLARHELSTRVEGELHWFPPWSLWVIVTVPIALLSVLDAAPWRNRRRAAEYPTVWLDRRLPHWLRDEHATPNARLVRGTIGGLYLVWATQAFIVQRGFEYVHVPETLLMLCLWAMHRWAWVPVVLVWLAVTSGVWLVADVSGGMKRCLDGMDPVDRRNYLPRHTLADPNRLALWPRCFRLRMPDQERYEFWDALRLHPPHEASPGWAELDEVAAFLRANNVKHSEVIAWFDSPHAVYLMLDLDPAFRYMHVHTVVSISVGEDVTAQLGRRWVLEDLHAAEEKWGRWKFRYVISDLEWVATSTNCDAEVRARALGPPRAPPHQLLPEHMPFPHEFPFNQPTIFRTRNGNGRYVIHCVAFLDDNPK